MNGIIHERGREGEEEEDDDCNSMEGSTTEGTYVRTHAHSYLLTYEVTLK